MYFKKGDVEIEYINVFFHLLNDELEKFDVIPDVHQRAINTILRTFSIAETYGINAEDYVQLVGQSILASYITEADPGLFLRTLFVRIGEDNFTEKLAKYVNDYKDLSLEKDRIAFCQGIIGKRYANTLYMMMFWLLVREIFMEKIS